MFLKEAGLENDLKFRFEFENADTKKKKQVINASTLVAPDHVQDKVNRSHDHIYEDK